MTTLLGVESVGATPSGHYLGAQIYCRYQCTTSGTVQSLHFYLGDKLGTWARIALYTTDTTPHDPYPGHVLAQGVITLTAMNTWHSLTGLSIPVTQGTYYWIGVCLDGYVQSYYPGVGTLVYVNDNSTGNIAFVDHPAHDSQAYDICSYYAAGVVPTPIEVFAVAMTATAEAPTPTVTAGRDITVAAVTATASAAADVPTVTVQVYCTIAGALATAAAQGYQPALSISEDNEAPTISVTALAEVPAISAQFFLTISAEVALAGAASSAPLFQSYEDNEVQTVNIDARAMDPYVSVEVYVTISAEVATAGAQAYDPTTSISEYNEVPTIAASATSAAPSVSTGTTTQAEISTATAAACDPSFMAASNIANATAVADATIPDTQVFVTQAKSEVTLVGERLEVFHDPAITSTTVAGYVAIAILVKARLDGKKATITIPPICNLELWDILSAYDDPAAQDSNYRVCGYTFEYDTRRAAYRHTLDLCAP